MICITLIDEINVTETCNSNEKKKKSASVDEVYIHKNE